MATPTADSYEVGSGLTLHVGYAGPPAWLQAMTATDTIYEVGVTPGTQALTFPTGSYPMSGYSSVESSGSYVAMIDGYGGAVWAEDIGKMLYLSTGEDQFAEQIMALSLGDDSPAYSWFQQPGFALTDGDASTANSDLYYNATDYSALPTAQKIDHVSYATEADWVAAWRTAGASFPVGWKNWVWRRKPDTFTMASGSPWCFRYHANQAVPASWFGAASLIVNQHNAYGPFRAWPPAFNTIDDDEWSENVWAGTSRRKFGIHALDVNAGTWQRLGVWVPDMAYGGFSTYTHSVRDDNTKRIWYHGTGGFYYLDLSDGLANATMSAVTAYTGTSQSIYGECSGALVWNDPNGRKLWYFQSVSEPNTILVYDLTAQTGTALDLSGQGLTTPAKPGAWPEYFPYVPMCGGYDPVTNTVHFVQNQRGGPAHCHSFVVPAGDATVAGNYTVDSRQLTLASGVAFATDANTRPSWGYNEKSSYLPSLGVCLLPQASGKMLAFRPEA